MIGKLHFVRKDSYLHVMKAKKSGNLESLEPTKSEVEILQVIWQYGPSTVRVVNDRLNEVKREVQYTSTLKLMQIMAEKGLLNRDESQMKHIYSAAQEERKTKALLLDRFVDSIFSGSVGKLVMELLGSKKASQKELDKIREMLDKMDNK